MSVFGYAFCLKTGMMAKRILRVKWEGTYGTQAKQIGVFVDTGFSYPDNRM
jgi:hypothetical protein